MAATKRAIDMTNVKERGAFNPKRKPAGDYRAKIVKVDDHKKEGEKAPTSWVFTLELVSDRRASYPYYCQFEDKHAWKIRNMLTAIGKVIPKKKVNVDPNILVNKEVGISLEDDEYDGKLKSVIQAIFPVSELSGDDPEDEGDDEEDDADEDDDDVDDLDLEEV